MVPRSSRADARSEAARSRALPRRDDRALGPAPELAPAALEHKPEAETAPLPKDPGELDHLLDQVRRVRAAPDVTPATLARLGAIEVRAYEARARIRSAREAAARSDEMDAVIGGLLDVLKPHPLAERAVLRWQLEAAGDAGGLRNFDAADAAWRAVMCEAACVRVRRRRGRLESEREDKRAAGRLRQRHSVVRALDAPGRCAHRCGRGRGLQVRADHTAAMASPTTRQTGNATRQIRSSRKASCFLRFLISAFVYTANMIEMASRM